MAAAFHGVPVGRTSRNGSRNASSIGPCSACVFAARPASRLRDSPGPGGLLDDDFGRWLDLELLAVDGHCGGFRGLPEREACKILRRDTVLRSAIGAIRVDLGAIVVAVETVEVTQKHWL